MNLFFDESTLIGGHHLIQPACKPISQDFGHQFGKAMHQAYGPKILDLNSISLFWNQSNVCRIQFMKISEISSPKKMNCCHHITLDNCPATFI
jgi:hypothetical protein